MNGVAKQVRSSGASCRTVFLVTETRRPTPPAKSGTDLMLRQGKTSHTQHISSHPLFRKPTNTSMIANSKDPSEFTFFPFTSPNPKRNRCRYPNNTNSKDLSTSKGFHSQQIHQSGCWTNATTGTKGTKISSKMSDFESTFDSSIDIRTKHTTDKQNLLFADFDDATLNDTFLKDEKSWVTFDARNDTTSGSENSDLSPMSTKVQVGQADTSEIADVEKDSDYNDDTVTSTTEYDDDVDYGPTPRATVNVDGAPQSCVESNSDKSESIISSTTKSYILMLVTNMGMNRTQVQNQQRATMMLNALNITYETVDGSDPSNKEIRNELFAISDTRGAYPQFFVVTDHGDNSEVQISFLGEFETIEGINDSSSLPDEILDAHPSLLTWSRIPFLSYQK